MSLSCTAGNARKQLYKATINTLEVCRKREENMVQIRKCRREETLVKKRRESVASAPNTQPSYGSETISPDENTLAAIVFALASNDNQAMEAAAIHLRKMLSIGENHLNLTLNQLAVERQKILHLLCAVSNPPLDVVIQSGVVPLLVDILRRTDMPKIQFEAAWALTNIVSGTSEHTKVVIEYRALPIFVELLSSGNDKVREQVVWALGNIAGDSPAYRDLAISHGALSQVLAQINRVANISMIKIATWALSNFCRGKPQPEFDQVKDALPYMQWLLCMPYDDVLANACWSLSYLSEEGMCSNLRIQAVIDAGICPMLVELLSHSSLLVVTPALRTLGNIATGDDVQTQTVIDNQALPRVLNLLTAKQTKKDIVREACWTISNITAGAKEQVQAVMDAKLFPPLLSLLPNADIIIKKEAVWAVANATSRGSDEQIKYLAVQGCIKPLCDLLACPDPMIIRVCLEGLENILTVGEAEKNAGFTYVNVYVSQIEDAGGLDKIEDLQSHENTYIYEKAVKIVANYLAEDYEDEMLASYDTPQTVFDFPTDQQPQVPPGGFIFM